MGLRAVIFDFGMVLSGPPDAEAHSAMLRITGLPRDRFESLYWAERHAYDQGTLSGLSFWQKFARDSGLDLDSAAIEELNRWDARHWTTQDHVMVDWQRRLKEHGLKTAILSNMGDSVLASMQRQFEWLHHFDVLVWSFQLGMVKPDPAIYHHTLKELSTRPEETLFLDDRLVNVEAARALGIRALEFSTVERLRADLIAEGLDRELPLPG